MPSSYIPIYFWDRLLAEPKLKEAKDIRKDIKRENHPDYAQSLFNLKSLYVTTKRYDDTLLNGINIYNNLFPKVFSIGIESAIMNFKTMEEPFVVGYLTLVYHKWFMFNFVL